MSICTSTQQHYLHKPPPYEFPDLSAETSAIFYSFGVIEERFSLTASSEVKIYYTV